MQMAFLESAYQLGSEKWSFGPLLMKINGQCVRKKRPKSRPLTEETLSSPPAPLIRPLPPLGQLSTCPVNGGVGLGVSSGRPARDWRPVHSCMVRKAPGLCLHQHYSHQRHATRRAGAEARSPTGPPTPTPVPCASPHQTPNENPPTPPPTKSEIWCTVTLLRSVASDAVSPGLSLTKARGRCPMTFGTAGG